MVVHVGGVKCTSTPSGATVKVDGVTKGTTTCAFNVPIGTRSIQFSKSGYVTQTKSVNVATGSVKYVNVTLAVLAGSIQCTSTPSGASIKVDGVSKGITPYIINNVAIGTRSVRFSKSGYASQTKNATVFGGRLANVNMTLAVLTGGVKCTSTPSGATVKVDGVTKGTTTCAFNVPTGTRSIRFSKSGYASQTKSVAVVAGSVKYVSVTLADLTGGVKCTSTPSGATVKVDGVTKGTTTCAFNVPTGTRSIRFSKSGYASQTVNVSIGVGGVKYVNVTLAILVGGVKCTSTPSGATVKVDGVTKGTTTCAFDVPVGTRSIQFSKSGYVTQTKSVNVATGSVKYVNVTLVAVTGGVKCTSTPSGATVKVDGVTKGTTPCAFNVHTGTRTIQFSKSGYVSQIKSVSVGIGGVKYVDVTLAVYTGGVKCTSTPSGATVKVDGVTKGTTPCAFNVPTGIRSILFSKSGYTSQTKSVNVATGSVKYVDAILLVLMGGVKCTSTPPGATVCVDGETKGTTPCAFNVPTGTISIQFSKYDYITQTKSVTVGVGGVKYVDVTLETVAPPVDPPVEPPVFPPGTLGSIECTSTPNAEVYLDDVYYGFGALIIYDLEIATYKITFRLAGFVDQEQYVVISSDDMTKYAYATMVPTGTPGTPETFTVICDSIPQGAIIQVD